MKRFFGGAGNSFSAVKSDGEDRLCAELCKLSGNIRCYGARGLPKQIEVRREFWIMSTNW